MFDYEVKVKISYPYKSLKIISSFIKHKNLIKLIFNLTKLFFSRFTLKGFVRSIGQEGLVKLTLHICEQGLKKAEEATKKFGKPISSWTLLLDLDGLNMRHLWRPGIKTVLHIIEILENNYPETLGRVIMTRAPR